MKFTGRFSGRWMILAALALLGFAGSYPWRLHVERGQYHIFVTLALAAAAYACTRDRRDRWVLGILIGLAMSVRPTVAIALAVLLLARAYRTVFAAGAVALVVFGMTLPFGGLELWHDCRYGRSSVGSRRPERVDIVDPSREPGGIGIQELQDS